MRNFWGKSIGGLILIAIGVIFFLNQTDVIDFDLGYVISHFWPVVLIVIGLNALASQGKFNFGACIWGAIMIGLGLVFLNNNFGWIPNFGVSDLFKYAIPVVLILIGIRLLFRPRVRSPKSEPEPYTPKEWQPYSSSLDHDDPGMPPSGNSQPDGTDMPGSAGSARPDTGSDGKYGTSWHAAKQEWKQQNREWKDDIRQRKREWKQEWKQWKHGGYYNHNGQTWHDGGSCASGVDHRHNFIGDVRLGRDFWELRPLNISHFVGDTEIDLTRANIPYGETTINISSFIGDVKIFVPNDLQLEISVRASAFLGDMSVFDRWEGGLFRNMKAESPQYYDAEKRIRVNVSTFIGDVRVKRVG